MFREELDDLEARYSDRLRIIHVRSRDPRHPAHLRGRIDRMKLDAMARHRPGGDPGGPVVPVWAGGDGDRPARRADRARRPSRTACTWSSSTAISDRKVGDDFDPGGRSRSPCVPASTRSRSQPATPSWSPRSRPGWTRPTPVWAGRAARARPRWCRGRSRWSRTSPWPQADVDAGYVLDLSVAPVHAVGRRRLRRLSGSRAQTRGPGTAPAARSRCRRAITPPASAAPHRADPRTPRSAARRRTRAHRRGRSARDPRPGGRARGPTA